MRLKRAISIPNYVRQEAVIDDRFLTVAARKGSRSPIRVSRQLCRSQGVVDFETVRLEHVGAEETKFAGADQDEHLSWFIEPVHDDHETLIAGDVFVSQLGLHRANGSAASGVE